MTKQVRPWLLFFDDAFNNSDERSTRDFWDYSYEIRFINLTLVTRRL